MSDSWEKMRVAKEEQYFEKENKAAMDRLKTREGGNKRLSPVTGEPMQQTTVMGVVVDRCPTSQGIWLDKGELEQILERATGDDSKSWLTGFLESLTGK